MIFLESKAITLSQLDIGQSAVIEKINIENTLKKRISQLGIIEGCRIRKILRSPFGDPCAYLIHSSVIALRAKDADRISVIPDNTSGDI